MPRKKQNLSGKAAFRLKEIREHFGFTRSQMAAKMNIVPTSYYKNEQGQTLPSYPALQRLHRDLGISMDWFLFGTGCMLVQTEIPEPSPPDFSNFWDQKMPGIRELLEHMEREPGMRHKMLAYYYKSRAENES